MESCEIAVVGAGIAGASLAAELARDRRVVLLEREAQPGYHTTGRSAALFSKVYGPAPIRALSRASETFFKTPPEGFSAHPLLSPRGVLLAARDGQEAALDAMTAELRDSRQVRRVDAAAARELCPLLRAEGLLGALWDDDSQDIDVHALHQGFLRLFRARGGRLQCGAELRGLARDGAGWRLETDKGGLRAEVVVDAAGAWADELAGLAAVRPIGLVPKRRTAMIVAPPEDFDPMALRMVVDIEEQFYLKPDAGKLLISPADETPSPPCDAQPEELDVAICVDRIERAFALSVRRIENRWAGLRSFVADKAPVAGYAPDAPGFFWLAGQGGYGIQTAPALARLAAALLRGEAVPDDIAAEGLDAAALAPARLQSGS
ncbi:FAD-dependent oxidoreductase [Phormidium willei BDU 130791]|nr:FAD-dependent oxidoreductase [Phormidium willei BDU 130791]